MERVVITIPVGIFGILLNIVFYFNRNRIPFSHFHTNIKLLQAQSGSEIVVDKQISFRAKTGAACPNQLTCFQDALVTRKVYDIITADTDVEAVIFAVFGFDNNLLEKIAIKVIHRNIDSAVTFA